MINPRLIAIINYIAMGILFIALLRMPYGYYMFLKIFIFLACIANAYVYNNVKNLLNLIVFIILAIIYNPIIPIHLDRSLWVIINILTIIPFILSAIKQNKEYKSMFENE